MWRKQLSVVVTVKVSTLRYFSDKIPRNVNNKYVLRNGKKNENQSCVEAMNYKMFLCLT